MTLRHCAATLPLAAALCSALAQPASPTVAPPAKDLPAALFGTTVHDPCRGLEDVRSPEAAAWMKASNERSRAAPAVIPGRQQPQVSMQKVDASVSARVFGADLRRGARAC